MRNIVLKKQALDDLQYWLQNDARLLRKIFDLLEGMTHDPFGGLGKLEALKGDLRGYWSRRINDEHRIVYSVTADSLITLPCRSHYK